MLPLLLTLRAWAEPASDPTLILVERTLRLQGVPAFRGAPDRSPRQQALWLEEATLDPFLRELLAPELAAAGPALRPGGTLAAGTHQPEYRGGDQEEGVISARAWLDARWYPGGVGDLTARPELTLDAVPGVDPGLAARELWAGARTARWAAGAGLRPLFLGPGRHGGLMLTDHARPAPLATISGQTGDLGAFGRLRGEVGAGWLDAPREDVDHPGWLIMDFRWAPSPWVELGASRVGLFWGEGRPRPPLGQLILPTDPHVYGDPDREEPDQDEMAALDARVTLPVGRWAAGPDTIELWWQYGGEDMIVRRALGIPYPALAGVGNVLGGQVDWGAWSAQVEGTRALDDYFRWYTGHRVYHDGFTQDGLSMGYAPGGDAMGLWGSLTWLPRHVGGQVSAETLTRVGVVESIGPNVLALSTDERRWRASAAGWLWRGGGWWKLEATIEQVQGADFVPGADELRWRLAVGRE